MEWLLDSRYDQIVNGIAEGRKELAEAVRGLIDSSPHVDQAALAAGYVDAR